MEFNDDKDKVEKKKKLSASEAELNKTLFDQLTNSTKNRKKYYNIDVTNQHKSHEVIVDEYPL